jgi:hypothetical protein
MQEILPPIGITMGEYAVQLVAFRSPSSPVSLSLIAGFFFF